MPETPLVFSPYLNNQPQFVPFLNNAATITYGHTVVWELPASTDEVYSTIGAYNTYYDGSNLFGITGTVSTATADAWLAGVAWGMATNEYGAAQDVLPSQIGLAVTRGVHPDVYTLGTSTTGDWLYAGGGGDGFAVQTATPDLTDRVAWIGRVIVGISGADTQTCQALIGGMLA